MPIYFMTTALLIVSLVTNLTVEGIKKLLNETTIKYSSNVLAAVVAVLMSCAQPRKQRAQHVSKVHAPARTGRETSDCLHRQSLPSVFSLRLFYHIAHIHCNSPVFLL